MSVSDIRPSGINHCLAVVHELLDFAPQRILVQLSCPLQRDPLQLEVVTKTVVTEVRLQPIEEKAVAEIEVWTVWTLEDHRDVSTLHEIGGRSSTVWSCIVSLPENIREPYRVRSQASPQVARVLYEVDNRVGIDFFIRRHSSDGEPLVGSKCNHQHCLSISQRSPHHLRTRLGWCQPGAILLFSRLTLQVDPGFVLNSVLIAE